MAVWFQQFWLLFCKNLLWKKRQPVSLVLEYIWPISVFLIVVLIKQHPDINPERHSTCYYRARALPSAGFLPFVQSFVCNIDNECLNADQNEAIPEYKDSQLYQIMDELHPLVSSEAFAEFMRELPATMQIFDAANAVLHNDTLLDQLTHDLPLSDLVRNTETLKQLLVEKHKILSEQTFVELLTKGSLNVTNLISTVFERNASNLHEALCENLSADDQYKFAEDESTLTNIICGLPREHALNFIDKLHENLDMEKLINFLLPSTTNPPTKNVETTESGVADNAVRKINYGEDQLHKIKSDVQELLPAVREVLAKVNRFKQTSAATDQVHQIDNGVGDNVDSPQASFKPARWQKFISKLYGHLLHADRRFGITAGNLGDNGRVWYGGLLKTMNSLTDTTESDFSAASDDVTTSASTLVLTRTKAPTNNGRNYLQAPSRPAVEEELWRRRFVSYIRHHPLSPYYAPNENAQILKAMAFFDPKNSLNTMLTSSFGRDKIRLKGKPFPTFEQLLRMLAANDDFIIIDKQSERLRNFLCQHREQVRMLAGGAVQPTVASSNIEMILDQKCYPLRMKRSANQTGDKQYDDFFASDGIYDVDQQSSFNPAQNPANAMLPDEHKNSLASLFSMLNRTLSHPVAQQVVDTATKTLAATSRNSLISGSSLAHNGDELLNKFLGGANSDSSRARAVETSNPQTNSPPDLRTNLCSGLNLVRDAFGARSPNLAQSDNSNYWDVVASGLCSPPLQDILRSNAPHQNLLSSTVTKVATNTASDLLNSLANQLNRPSAEGRMEQPILDHLARQGISALSDFVRGMGGDLTISDGRNLRNINGNWLDGLAGRRKADALDVAAVWFPNSIKLPRQPLLNNLLIKVATVLLRGVNDKLESVDTTITNEFPFFFDQSLYPQLNVIAQLIQTQFSELTQILVWTYATDSAKLFRLFQGVTNNNFLQDFCANPNYFFAQPPALAVSDALNRIAQHSCANIDPRLLVNEFFSFFNYDFVGQALSLVQRSSADFADESASFGQLVNEIRHFATSVYNLLVKVQQFGVVQNLRQASASENVGFGAAGNVNFAHELQVMLTGFAGNFSIEEFEKGGPFALSSMLLDYLNTAFGNSSLDIQFLADALDSVTSSVENFLVSLDDKDESKLVQLLSNLTIYAQFKLVVRNAIHKVIQNRVSQSDTNNQKLSLAIDRAVQFLMQHAATFLPKLMNDSGILKKIVVVQTISQLMDAIGGGNGDELEAILYSDNTRERDSRLYVAAARQAALEWLTKRITLVLESGKASTFLPNSRETTKALLSLLSAEGLTELGYIINEHGDLLLQPSQAALTAAVCRDELANNYRIPPRNLTLCEYARTTNSSLTYPSVVSALGLSELLQRLNNYYALFHNSSDSEKVFDDDSIQNPQLTASSSSWWTKVASSFDWPKLYQAQSLFSQSVGQLLDSIRVGHVQFDLLQYFSEWLMDHLTSFSNMSFECNNIILPRLDALPAETRARAYAYLDVGQVAARIMRNILNKIEPLPMNSACWQDNETTLDISSPSVSVETFLYEIIEQLEIERIVIDSLDLYGNAIVAASLENSTSKNDSTFSNTSPLPLFDCFQALQDVVQIGRSMSNILLLPQQQPQSRLSQLFSKCLDRVDFSTFMSHLADLSGILQAAMSIVHNPAFRRLSQQIGSDPTTVINAVAALDSLPRIKRDVQGQTPSMFAELFHSLNQIFPAASSNTYSILSGRSTPSRNTINFKAPGNATVGPANLSLADFVKNHDRLREHLQPINSLLTDAILPAKLDGIKKWLESLLKSNLLCDENLSTVLKVPREAYTFLKSIACNDNNNMLSAAELREIIIALAENVRISSLFVARSSNVSDVIATRANMTAENVRENVRHTFETSRQFIPAVVRAVRRAHLNLTELIHSYQNVTAPHGRHGDSSTNQLLQFVLSTTGQFLCGHTFTDVLKDLKMVASFGNTFDNNNNAGDEHHNGEKDDEDSSMSASQHVEKQQPPFLRLNPVADRWSRKSAFNFHAWPVSDLHDAVFDQAHYDKFLNDALSTHPFRNNSSVLSNTNGDFLVRAAALSSPTILSGNDEQQWNGDARKRDISAEGEELFEDPFTAASSFQTVTRNPASIHTATTRRRAGGGIVLQFPVRLPGSSFHNEFCTKIFHGLSRMPGGSIMWSYLKPLIRGRIIFYPDTREAWAIMQQANSTFELLGRAAHALRTLANSSHVLHSVERHLHDDPLYSRFATHIVNGLYEPKARKIALRTLSTTREELNAAFNEIVRGKSGNGKDVIERLASFSLRVADVIECVNLEHRFEAVKTKARLQKRARELAEDKELLAAVSFLNLYNGKPRPRSMPLQLPRHVKYEIQMDIDNVPFTHRIKDYFYVPGPRDNFLDDMRYFRGFVQLQDTIDRAIILLQKQLHLPASLAGPPLPATYLQQMPYPCYEFDLFNHVVYSTFPMQVILAWIYMIALFIRQMVYERESGLERLMIVHGMRGGVQWLSSCLVTYLTMSLISAIILGILKLGGIFTASSSGVLFYIFQLFSLSSIAMSYMVAAFFTSSTVAALTGVIVYLISYLPFIVIVALEANLHYIAKLLFCLSSTTAFSFAMFYVNRYEESGVGAQWSNIQRSSVGINDEWNVQYACYMLMFDTILYFTIGFYVRVLMTRFGDGGGNQSSSSICSWPWKVQRALVRYCTRRYRKRTAFASESAYYCSNNLFGNSRNSDEISSNEESSSQSNRNKVAGIVCIGLTKVFTESSSLGLCRRRRNEKSTKAVDNFTMSFYESEITSLLGHNGAGKSTTINMICGFTRPTSGASFIYGYNADQRKNMPANTIGDHGVGVCPQQNVLFGFMTVREHLEFYCKLKSGLSFSRAQIIRDVDSILRQLELCDAQTERAVNLSGGMKRRLMVAIAFCAGSRVVVLDEPTSGVDPVARRQIWDLVARLKHGRTILLTTHHLDEADILSDRIVIIHQGKLQCCGSPLYLKTHFGSGYQLTIALKDLASDVEQKHGHPKVDTFSSCGSTLHNLLASSSLKNEHMDYHDSSIDTEVSSPDVTLEFWQQQTKRYNALDTTAVNGPLMMEVTSPDQFSLSSIMLPSGVRNTREAALSAMLAANETSFLGHEIKAITAADHVSSSVDRLQMLDNLVTENVPHTQRVDASAHHVTYLLPMTRKSTRNNDSRSKAASNMIRLLQQLHLRREELGLVTFGLTSPSMEDVFLNIITCVDRGIDVGQIPLVAAAHLARNAFISRRDSNCSFTPGSASSSRRSSVEHNALPVTKASKTGGANFQYSYSAWDRRCSMDEKGGAPSNRRDCRRHYTLSRSLVHMRALLRKRLYHNMRNTKTLLSTLCLPILFILIAMSFSFLRPSHNDYPSLKLHAGLYGPESRMFAAAPRTNPDVYITDGTARQARKIAENLKLLQSSVQCEHNRGNNDASDDENDKPFDYENEMCFAKPRIVIGTSGSMDVKCRCDEKFVYKCESAKNSTISNAFTPDMYVLNNVTKDMLYDLSGHELERWLLSTTYDDEYAESRYGGWSLGHSTTNTPYYSFRQNQSSQAAAKVWYNNRGFHAMTAYLNGLNNALLSYVMSSTAYGITTYNHPLNLTATQLSRYTILQNVADVGVALVILTGFSFIPAAAIVFLVGERVSEEKQLQMISGVRPWLYWLVAFIWDYVFVYLLSVPLVALVLYAFQIDMYYAGYNFAAVLSLIGLFGFACLPQLYIISRMFDDASFAYTVLFCGNVFVGMLSVTTTTTLSFFYFAPDLARLHWICETLFLTFLPQYCLGSGLVETVKAHIRSRIAQRMWCDGAKAAVSPVLVPACRMHFTLNPFRWDVMGNRLVAMAVQGVVFFVVNLLIEYVSWSWLQRKIRSLRKAKIRSDVVATNDDEQEDVDVVEERLRVLRGRARSDALQINSLSKVYSSGAGSEHLAVDQLSFGVRRGECFGLLGFNGAGKTTTFRMLAGQVLPTTGTAVVNNTHKLTKSSVYTLDGLLGYCPQTDALDMLLTVHETLMIHAELRGTTPHSERLRQVQKLTRTLQLLPYTNVRNANLSGGNKRKVCVAIAMLGNPKLILMDEPTSGMDPGTRRLVWEVVLNATQQGRSVILTSHSMEECDALCSRLGIMLNGRLKCIGTPVHLKNKFGRGYVCSVRMSAAYLHPEKLLDFMQTQFGDRCALRHQHHQAFDFVIAAGDADLAQVFQVLELARVVLNLEDYAISQCTLDQVFVEIASQQAEDLRDRTESVLVNNTNSNVNNTVGNEGITVGANANNRAEMLVDLSCPLDSGEIGYLSDDECLHEEQKTLHADDARSLHSFHPPYLRMVTTTPVKATIDTRLSKAITPDIDPLKSFNIV